MNFDGILRDDRCDRCARLMNVRAVSFFNEESVCSDCLEEERELIMRLRLRGLDPVKLAGCGNVPQGDPDEVDDQERRPPMYH